MPLGGTWGNIFGPEAALKTEFSVYKPGARYVDPFLRKTRSRELSWIRVLCEVRQRRVAESLYFQLLAPASPHSTQLSRTMSCSTCGHAATPLAGGTWRWSWPFGHVDVDMIYGLIWHCARHMKHIPSLQDRMGD